MIGLFSRDSIDFDDNGCANHDTGTPIRIVVKPGKKTKAYKAAGQKNDTRDAVEYRKVYLVNAMTAW